MKRRTMAYVITALSLVAPHDLFAEKPAGWSTRQLVYRQEKGLEYRVTQTRDGQRLTIRYQHGKESQEPSDVNCVRNLQTGRLESCETFPRGGSRRYQFTEKEVKVTLSSGRVSTHTIETIAHPQLLDAICAFTSSGRESQRVLYISQGSESFSTQGFVISREGRQTVTTPAGTFTCAKVKLALDFPMGLLFRLDFLVAADRDYYPYIVKGRTTSGGNFELTRIE